MKSIALLLALPLMALAADPAKPPSPEPRLDLPPEPAWYSRFSVAPFGALNHPDMSRPVWGAGLDVGYNLNESLSLHISNLAYDSPKTTTHSEHGKSSSSQGFDSGMGIDETSVLFRGDVWNYKSRLNLFLIASGDREWNEEIWGLGAGGGIGLNVSKHVALEGDVRVRAWFKHRPKDLPIRFLVNIKF